MIRTVAGLSLDYVLLNWLGFVCYTVYTCLLYFGAKIKRAYAEQYGSSNTDVQINDVAFAVHALLMNTILGV